jgi:pyrroloquinoline-quinone synthase
MGTLRCLGGVLFSAFSVSSCVNMAGAMDRNLQLDALIQQFDLNAHPFYQEWRAGTLPTRSLSQYAGEYAAFVGTIALGWETVGEPGYAEEEREHEVLWSHFQAELKGDATAALPSTSTLVTAAKNLFQAGRSEALGALYAFEAQQPHTSRSKLDGLNEHYSLSDAAKEYFVVHADDVHEIDDIRAQVQGLTESEFARAKNACAVVCTSMLGALDGIYYNTPLEAAV